METYKYNTKTLQFEVAKNSRKYWQVLLLGVTFLILGFSSGVKVNTIVEKIPIIIRMNEEEFSEENLKREIQNLKFKYPDIILAQAKEESGYFKSPLFKENHNLFGLKIPGLRPTVSVGENRGHAKFKNWRESVVERALWECQNTQNVHSEEEYYALLDAIYAEKPGYSKRLKKLL